MNGQNWLFVFVSWQPVGGPDQSQEAKGIELHCLSSFFFFKFHVPHTSSTPSKDTLRLLALSLIGKALRKKTCSPGYLA